MIHDEEINPKNLSNINGPKIELALRQYVKLNNIITQSRSKLAPEIFEDLKTRLSATIADLRYHRSILYGDKLEKLDKRLREYDQKLFENHFVNREQLDHKDIYVTSKREKKRDSGWRPHD
jgi:hypothetical protein